MPLWRETFKSPRIGKLDARVAFFIFPPLAPIFRMETLACMIAALVTLYIIEVRYGMNFPSAVRYVRSKIAGKIRRPNSNIPVLIDYQIADRAERTRQKQDESELSQNIVSRALRFVGLSPSPKRQSKAKGQR